MADRTVLPEARPGLACLVKEPRPRVSVALFKRMLADGRPGLCVTRLSPTQVRERWGFDGETLWLGKERDSHLRSECMRLDSILRTLRTFVTGNRRGVILLDGLEYLSTRYSFAEALHSLHDIGETVALSEATLLIPVSPEAFAARDLALLEREIEVLAA